MKVPPAYLHVDIAIVKAITHLHAGIGRGGELVDLPIQRDEFGYPCVYSSSLKGALKTALLSAYSSLKDRNKAKEAVKLLLGSEPEEGETFESSIAILDAYLLAIPVRSLKGVYSYVTSPHLLKLFAERCSLLQAFRSPKESGSPTGLCESLKKDINELASLKGMNAACVNSCDAIKINELGEKALLAEEFQVSIEEKGLEGLRSIVSKLKLEKPLLVVSDDISRDIIERSLIRPRRIRLERGIKKVTEGALWTEEYLPRKSILHTMFLYKRPTSKERNASLENYVKNLKDFGLVGANFQVDTSLGLTDQQTAIVSEVAKNVKEVIRNYLKGYIILGGHETIGKGIVGIEFLEGGNQ